MPNGMRYAPEAPGRKIANSKQKREEPEAGREDRRRKMGEEPEGNPEAILLDNTDPSYTETLAMERPPPRT